MFILHRSGIEHLNFVIYYVRKSNVEFLKIVLKWFRESLEIKKIKYDSKAINLTIKGNVWKRNMGKEYNYNMNIHKQRIK